jgi:uncharacterized alkaline shock family protein YloU
MTYHSKDESSEVSNEMICSIANLAALGVDGIEKMFMRMSDELVDAIYPSAVAKGVRVVNREDGYVIDLHVITRSGVDIVKVGRQAQIKVKESVEIMAGKPVSGVNIHVKGSGIY